jgi:multiple sugar transport system substrate-binding protein
MKISRKLLLLALAVVAFSTIAVGQAAAQKTEITYMAWYNTTQSEAADIQKTLDKFNASQDKIHVTMIVVSRADYETKLNTMAAGKQLPDTCIMAEPMTKWETYTNRMRPP